MLQQRGSEIVGCAQQLTMPPPLPAELESLNGGAVAGPAALCGPHRE